MGLEIKTHGASVAKVINGIPKYIGVMNWSKKLKVMVSVKDLKGLGFGF